MTHLDEETLLAVDGGAGGAAVREHLAGCAHCQARLEEWHALWRDLRELEGNALEPGELHLLRALFRARGPLPAGRGELMARLIPRFQAGPLAVRGQAMTLLADLDAGPYHFTVEVSLAGAKGSHRLYGQLLREGEPAGEGEVVLTEEGGSSASARLDELGEFELADLPSGRYRFVVDLPGERIVAEPMAIGAPGDT